MSDEDTSQDGEITNRASIGRNIFHMMNAQIATWTIAIGLSIIVPRFLGPAVLGKLQLTTSLWLIAGILITMGTSRFLQLRTAQSQRMGLALVGPILMIRTFAFGIATVVLGLYVAWTSSDGVFIALMVIFGCDVLIGRWSETFSMAFVGLERMATPALVGVTVKVLGAVLVVIGLVLGGGAYAVVGGGLIAVTAGLMIFWVRFRRLAKVRIRGWRAVAPEVLRGSMPFMFSGAALVLYQQIDVIVISWAAQDRDLGWYGAADSLFGTLLFPAAVITSTIFPTLGRLHETDPAALQALVSRTFSTLVVVAVPIGAGVALVAPTFAPLLYGEDFRETGTVLTILGPVIILTFGTILFGTVAQATGRVRLWTLVLLLSAALTVPLDILLVPWAVDRFDNGAIGGAAAYVVTETAQFSIGLVVIAPFLLTRDTIWRVVRTFIAGAVMLGAGWPLRNSFLLLPIMVCGVVYVLAVLPLGVLGDDERRMLRNVAIRLGLVRSVE